jgi:hypothetical protein
MSTTIARQPIGLHVLNHWESTHGPGTEVTVVADSSDATQMHVNGPAFEDLLYTFQKIDAPDYCPIVSCVLTTRTFYPGPGCLMYSRARVGGAMYAGSPHAPGAGMPLFRDEVDDWASVVTTVGKFNAAAFGCYANWSGQPPALVKLGVVVTYVSAGGGFVSLVG